eukprot:Plantae.Rhodophyta-Palmaria_palmata.ctg8584.p1 GENE.Plantae.Rhodophyta-Palmaria_palmata.ctg8584~~Plantae.Rhodophyta-Palmaria_palmata.ctg8584.p1  ORF type:complete len:141 (-),score=14.67 Plantae.Rhodophyta-Palmaria_palmata.ctg8584:156-578(-)
MWALAVGLFCLFIFYFFIELFRAHGWAPPPLISHDMQTTVYGATASGEEELSYEELLAIGDAVGDAFAGLRQEQVDIVLAVDPSAETSYVGGACCVICLEGLNESENATLPCLCPPFHSACIARWLSAKASCPCCRCKFQ